MPSFDNSLTYIGVLIETAPGANTYRGPCGMDGRTFTRTTETQDAVFASCQVGRPGTRARVEGVDDWTISGQGTMELDAYDMLDLWKSGPAASRGPRKVVVLGYTGPSSNPTVHVHYIMTGLLQELGLPQSSNAEMVQASVNIIAADGTIERVAGAFTGTIVEDD